MIKLTLCVSGLAEGVEFNATAWAVEPNECGDTQVVITHGGGAGSCVSYFPWEKIIWIREEKNGNH